MSFKILRFHSSIYCMTSLFGLFCPEFDSWIWECLISKKNMWRCDIDSYDHNWWRKLKCFISNFLLKLTFDKNTNKLVIYSADDGRWEIPPSCKHISNGKVHVSCIGSRIFSISFLLILLYSTSCNVFLSYDVQIRNLIPSDVWLSPVSKYYLYKYVATSRCKIQLRYEIL